MRGVLIACAASLAITAMALVLPRVIIQREHTPYIEIVEDNGGMVSDYATFYGYIRQAHIPVHVMGACISACTLVLSLPPGEVCVGPQARFGFHLATTNDVDNPATTQYLVEKYYSAAVQTWIKVHGPLVSIPIFMTAKDMISLGVLAACAK